MSGYYIKRVENQETMFLDMNGDEWSTSVDNATRTDYAVALFIARLLKQQAGYMRRRYFICSEEEII